MRDKNRRQTRPYSSASELQNTVLLLGLHPFHTSSPNCCAAYAYPKSNCQTRPYACRPYAQVPGAKTRVPLSLWPGSHGSSLNVNKLNQKDVKLGMSKKRLSVMLALVYTSPFFLVPLARHGFSCLEKVLAWLLALSTQQKSFNQRHYSSAQISQMWYPQWHIRYPWEARPLEVMFFHCWDPQHQKFKRHGDFLI